jgi:hypothetical protein
MDPTRSLFENQFDHLQAKSKKSRDEKPHYRPFPPPPFTLPRPRTHATVLSFDLDQSTEVIIPSLHALKTAAVRVCSTVLTSICTNFHVLVAFYAVCGVTNLVLTPNQEPNQKYVGHNPHCPKTYSLPPVNEKNPRFPEGLCSSRVYRRHPISTTRCVQCHSEAIVRWIIFSFSSGVRSGLSMSSHALLKQCAEKY